MRAADELVEFLARQIPAEQLGSFRASASARQRVWDLVQKEKDQGLTPDEQCELEDYEKLEHLLILAKAKAREQAAHG